MTKNKLKKKIDSNVDWFVENYGIAPIWVRVKGNVPYTTTILEEILPIDEDESIDNLLEFAEYITNEKYSLMAADTVKKEFLFLEIG